MDGHVHISGLGLVVFALEAMVVFPLLHLAAIWLSSTPFGQALAISL